MRLLLSGCPSCRLGLPLFFRAGSGSGSPVPALLPPRVCLRISENVSRKGFSVCNFCFPTYSLPVYSCPVSYRPPASPPPGLVLPGCALPRGWHIPLLNFAVFCVGLGDGLPLYRLQRFCPALPRGSVFGSLLLSRFKAALLLLLDVLPPSVSPGVAAAASLCSLFVRSVLGCFWYTPPPWSLPVPGFVRGSDRPRRFLPALQVVCL